MPGLGIGHFQPDVGSKVPEIGGKKNHIWDPQLPNIQAVCKQLSMYLAKLVLVFLHVFACIQVPSPWVKLQNSDNFCKTHMRYDSPNLLSNVRWTHTHVPGDYSICCNQSNQNRCPFHPGHCSHCQKSTLCGKPSAKGSKNRLSTRNNDYDILRKFWCKWSWRNRR